MKLKTIFLGVLLLIKGSVFAEGLPLSFTANIDAIQVPDTSALEVCYGLRNITGIQPLPLVHQFRVNGGLWILTQGTPQCAPSLGQPFDLCNVCTGIPSLNWVNSAASIDVSVCYFGRYCAISNRFTVFPNLIFVKKPAFPSEGSVNGAVFFQYDVKNVGIVGVPFNNISVNVTSGMIKLDSSRTTCGSILPPGQTCTLAYTFFAPETMGAATGSLNIEYGGISSLETNDLAFEFENPLFIYATEGRSNAGQKNDIVSYCPIDPNTRKLVLAECESPNDPLFEDAEGIAFNALGDKAYISNGGRGFGNSISTCDVDKLTGVLSNCEDDEFDILLSPEDLAVTPENDRIYIANLEKNNIVFCDILANDRPGNCQVAVDNIPDAEGIALNTDATKAYIANRNKDSVVVCDRDKVSGFLNNCQTTPAGQNDIFSDPRAIALNLDETFAYIANRSDDSVTVCDINPATGLLNNCQKATEVTDQIRDPEGLAIIPDGQNVYVGSFNSVGITPCVVGAGGVLNCDDRQNGNFPGVDNVKINGIINLPCVNVP